MEMRREKSKQQSKKLSLREKILIIITALSITGAAAVLVIFLAFDANKTGETSLPPDDTTTSDVSSGDDSTGARSSLAAAIASLPSQEALDEVLTLLDGYWSGANNMFVGFVYVDGVPTVDYGLFQSGFGIRGAIVNSYAVDKYEVALVINIPAVPASEINEAQPERTEIIYIDVAGLFEPGATIRTKISGFGSGGWYTYKHGGDTIEEALNSV